jgi:integrase
MKIVPVYRVMSNTLVILRFREGAFGSTRLDRPGLRRREEAAYLTGFRRNDLRSIRRDQITVDGIKVWQFKDGKHEIRQWSDSLRRLVRKELERSNCDQVFTNRSGQGWSMSAIQSPMRTRDVSWTFHDLRAKADSDHETGVGLMRRYNRARKLRAVK